MYMSVLDGYDDRTTLKNNVCYIIRDRQDDNPLIKSKSSLHTWIASYLPYKTENNSTKTAQVR